MKKAGFFLEKSINLWWKNYLLNVSRNFVFQLLFTGYYLPLAISKKLNIFFKNPYVFSNSQNFALFEKLHFLSRLLRPIFYVEILAVQKNFNILFWKTQPFFLKKTNFFDYEKFIISVAFCSKVATFNDFLKCEISLEKPRNFLNKVTFWTFLKNLLIPSHITANWQHLAILDNLSYFSRETRPYFKKGNIGTLWAILLSQSIFRQYFLHLTSSRFQMFC